MTGKLTLRAMLGCAAALLLALAAGAPAAQTATPCGGQSVAVTLGALKAGWDKPARTYKPHTRWWWPGNALTKADITWQLEQMAAQGIGGVEIQPVYPVALDDEATGIRTHPFLSDAFLEDVKFAARTARGLGMRVDLTPGSGWPV
jgi:hypothetical protein